MAASWGPRDFTQLTNSPSLPKRRQGSFREVHIRNRKHLLVDVIVISVCAILGGCDGPTAIHRFAANRREWFEGFLELAHGIPSRDCIRRVLMVLRPDAFQRCFQEWIADASCRMRTV